MSSKLGAEFDVGAIYEMMQATYRYGVCPWLREELIAAGRRESVPDDPPAMFFPTWFGRYPLARLARMAEDCASHTGRSAWSARAPESSVGFEAVLDQLVRGRQAATATAITVSWS